MALVGTLLAATPATWQQIRRPSKEGFVWCMANSAWAFFLFSFQAHEKSILLPLLPVAMLVGLHSLPFPGGVSPVTWTVPAVNPIAPK
jgi:alpha-1,3-glucosyltransferase